MHFSAQKEKKKFCPRNSVNLIIFVNFYRKGKPVNAPQKREPFCRTENNAMPLMTQEEIKKIIPHRDPFLLIDTIEEMEEGKRVVATKYMKEDEFWFKGHFPDYPVVPGVLMLEMMAQAGAVSMLALPENKGKLGFFGGVKEAKFRRQVVPGDLLRIEVEIIKVKGPVGVGKGVCTVNGEKAVSAEITFAIK